MVGNLDMVIALACEVDTTHLMISLRLDKCCKGRSRVGQLIIGNFVSTRRLGKASLRSVYQEASDSAAN